MRMTNGQDWVTRKKWFTVLAGIVDFNQQERKGKKSLLMEEGGKNSGKEWYAWLKWLANSAVKPNEREPTM